jgi:hypothetical protein
MRLGQLGIERDRLGEELARAQVRRARDVVELPRSLAHQVPGAHVRGARARGARALAPQKLGLDRAGDAARDFVLHGEDLGELAVVALRPEVRAGAGIDELRRDPHALARLAHAAFEHVAHAELARGLLHVDGPAFVDKARVARDDEEPAEARQRGDDVLRDAVGEVLLLGLAAQIREGQHRDRGLVGSRRAGAGRFRRRAGEAVAAPRHRDDVARAGVHLTEGLAQRGDVHLQRVLLDDLAGPDLCHEPILADDLPLRGDQGGKHVEGAAAEAQRRTVARQHAASEVEREAAEQHWLVTRPVIHCGALPLRALRRFQLLSQGP